MSKYCVQYTIVCEDETKQDTAFSNIQSSIDNLVSRWENNKNRNGQIKGLDHIENKFKIHGRQRMSEVAEKTAFYNHIKGLLNPPFITGKVSWHLCTHDEDNLSPCVIAESYEG